MIKNIFIVIFILGVGSSMYAQSHKTGQNHPKLPNFERDRFHFGFTLGGNSTSFKMNYDLTAFDSLQSIETNGQSGFNIGLVGSMRFNRYFTLRFTPTLAFAQRNVEYTFVGNTLDSKTTRIIESTYLQFPLLLKYRSQRNGNFAAYVIGGGNYAYDLSSQFNVNNDVVISEQVLKVNRSNYFAEAGFGVDLFMDYFKFSIELKYSYGLNNIVVKDGSFWVQPISNIRPKMFTISFHFEG